MASSDFATEADFMAAVVATAQHSGWRCVHVRPGNERSSTVSGAPRRNDIAGFPDLLLIHPGAARIVAAELKTNTGRLTAHQKKWLQDLRAAGVETYVWRPSNWFEMDDALRNPLQLSLPLLPRRRRRTSDIT